MHASCESPWHSLAKRHLLGACFPRMAPFRSMLLTLRGGPESLAPRAHQIPVYLMVFSTFLCCAFTAHGAVMIRDGVPGSCTPTLRLIPPIQKSDTMAPSDTSMRGRYDDSAPYLLPAGDCGTPVALRHAALRMAKPPRRWGHAMRTLRVAAWSRVWTCRS